MDPCGADTCKKPNVAVLTWIQCDRCEFWFHLACIGLPRDKDYKNEYFACNKCWDLRNAVELEEEPGNPLVSERENPNVEESGGGHLNADENNLDVSFDISGFQAPSKLNADGECEFPDPVIVEPEIINNNGVVAARIHRKAAVNCRKLINEKIKSGQLKR